MILYNDIRLKIALLLFINFWVFTQEIICQDEIEWYLPIDANNRKSWEDVRLTEIGNFGILRNARPNIPAHLHTGVDMKRPYQNYANEPIFPIAEGIVISLRDDGPYAQVIIEHRVNPTTIWSVYEHIAGIIVTVGDHVNPRNPIARFMTTNELNKYGWQFDHIHLEIMKTQPYERKPTEANPNLYFSTYWAKCYSEKDLMYYYYNPEHFLKSMWNGDEINFK